MSKQLFSKLLICFMMICFSPALHGQSKGDILYKEGLELQKTMTVISQNAAIRKFQSAKVIYTVAEKKKRCDGQIDVCNKNIKKIKAQANANKKVNAPKEEEPKEDEEKKQPEPAHVEVSLVANPVTLEYACNPKGRTQTIEVGCNVEWKVTNNPEWVEIYTTTDKCIVLAQKNETGDKRSGVITISAGDKQVLVVVNQKTTLVKKVKKAFDK